MLFELKIAEVDPIHSRIILSVESIPTEQPPRPETPSVVHSDDEVEIPITDE
jgi:small subunit ribosomal protein S1